MGKATNMEKLKVASLFSGCGGMDLGVIGGFNYLNNHYDKNSCKYLSSNLLLVLVRIYFRNNTFSTEKKYNIS